MSDLYQSPISPGRSLYEDTVGERPKYPPLDGSRTAEFLIVGGGYTGLSAALALAEGGAEVCVLDMARFGDGASGRNGGQLGTGQRVSILALEEELGFERSKALFDLAEDAKAHLLALDHAHGIDLEYTAGQFSLVHKRRLLDDYSATADALALRYNYPHIRFMKAAETAERVGSSAYHGGIRDLGTGHIHPLKLLVGLARAAAGKGAALHENTPVKALRRTQGRIVAETARGSVTAGRVLMATNAHGTGLCPEADDYVLPIRSFMAATAPLERPEAVLPGGEAADDSRFVVRYFRKDREGRLLFGGREAYSAAGGPIEPQIRRQIGEVYPHLAGIELTHAWGGSVALTMKRMPFVREVARGITVIGGFSGHGVTLSTFAGRLYGESVLGRGDRLGLLSQLEIPRFPGGLRLRKPLLVLAMTWYSLRDRL